MRGALLVMASSLAACGGAATAGIRANGAAAATKSSVPTPDVTAEAPQSGDHAQAVHACCSAAADSIAAAWLKALKISS